MANGFLFCFGPDLTHATLNFSENRGKAPLLLSMIDEKLARGVDVTLDTYPYLPGCTTLAALIPSWASSGGPTETLKRLQDPETRERIRVAVEETGCDGGHGIPTNWEEIQVCILVLAALVLPSSKVPPSTYDFVSLPRSSCRRLKFPASLLMPSPCPRCQHVLIPQS